MEHDLQDTVALLARTPTTLDAFLRDLPESWTRSNEGAETWSVFDILGHLIHGERTDWMPRARMILQFGERSEEHTSELQSRLHLVCRLLLEKKKKDRNKKIKCVDDSIEATDRVSKEHTTQHERSMIVTVKDLLCSLIEDAISLNTAEIARIV